jgi:hypothetical protein
VKLPSTAEIPREKITGYLLVRQQRNDKSGFLEKGGYCLESADTLIADLARIRDEIDASEVDNNQFGRYFEIVGTLRGPSGAPLRVRTIWMTEHLSGDTRFITLIPIASSPAK